MKTLICRRCKKEVTKLIDNKNNQVLCYECDNRINHLRTCQYCKKVFGNQIALCRHRNKFHNEEVARY